MSNNTNVEKNKNSKKFDIITILDNSKRARIFFLIALGISGLTLLQEALNTATPLLAFGEIDLQEVKEMLTTGISGLAVDEAITKNFNSIREFHRLLKASSTQEQRHSFQ